MLVKSSPPRCVSPFVATTSKTPLSMVKGHVKGTTTKIIHKDVLFSLFVKTVRMAAAVGPLMIPKTFVPQMVPASFEDCLYASLKYAGTVMTA